MKGWIAPFSLFLMFLLMLVLAACGQQNVSSSASVEVDMSVRAEPAPLAVGETTLIVTLRDASDSPIDRAILRIHGDMDHAGMTPVDREARESVNGEYRVPFEWTMGGGWIVTITAQLPDNGGEITETFDFFVEAVSSESVINRYSGMDMKADATAENGMDMPEDAEVNITYQSDNDPARSGDATVTITLTSGDGNPITDASVNITGDMAHEGMMPVSGEGEHTGDGQYVVPLRWTMAGDWVVTVEVTLADGRQFEQVFDQEVVVP
ncbi:MAG: FixH family protein [Anaerolineae bacterium]|nr:FixH family protein [Anaerolineae bacterium]